MSVVPSHQLCVHLLSKPKETSRDGEKNTAGGKVYEGGPRQEEDTTPGETSWWWKNNEEMQAATLEMRERKAWNVTWGEIAT